MKILLIDPPFYRILGFYNRYFPLGIVTIGTFLKEAGCEVVLYDTDYNENPKYMDYSLLPQFYPAYLSSFKDENHPVWKEIAETITRLCPDIIGISIWTTYAASAFHVAKLSKELAPGSSVVMGGPHAAVKADEILKICPDVDYVVRGDGEVPMLELVRQISSGRSDFSSIKGLSFRGENSIIHNPSGQTINDLELLSFPDRSLLVNESRYTAEDMGLIMSSRGCPYACSYCATHTRRVNYRPIDNVIDEIKFVKEKYGSVLFCFKDDSFTVNKKRVEQFCDRLIAEKLKICWECNTRVDLIDKNILQKMEKAGCSSIKVGIESGSERILKKMNKGITLKQIKMAAELFKESGIFWTGYFMMGIPGETVDEIYQTLNLMYEIKPDFASISVYEPFPGTEIFSEGVERDLVKLEMTLQDFYVTLPNDYYKLDTKKQVDTIAQEEFAALVKIIKNKFHMHNKNLQRIWRRAQNRVAFYVVQPKMLWSDFNKYMSWR
ncbi:MAG: hypothetical protein CVV39_02270 [Planctomycetes bacterium HGW-Planctomycetes-1]|nr:MAG: hypothetical protein CVV39_02270 [Planctomycetes bacterium HGW-Planctomycetes-1]